MTVSVEVLPSEPLETRVPGSGLVSITVVNTSTTLYQVTPGRTARIKKIMYLNRSAVGGILQIGYGDFTQVFPGINVFASLDDRLTEAQIPEYWFRQNGSATADIVAKMQTAGAIPVDVFIEVEEKGGY